MSERLATWACAIALTVLVGALAGNESTAPEPARSSADSSHDIEAAALPPHLFSPPKTAHALDVYAATAIKQ